MTSYTATLEQFTIKSTMFTDARLPGGLMVANPREGEVVIDRPRSSIYIAVNDGVATKEIYFHEGLVSVFSSVDMFYAQARIPEEMDAALDFVVEELDVDAPLLDLLYRDIASQLASSDDAIIYLTDKSLINGVYCHQIAVRGPEVDLQLWVEEGSQPLLRRIMMTSKWEGGAPRFVSEMSWDTAGQIDPEIFRFNAPKGATDIGFINEAAKP